MDEEWVLEVDQQNQPLGRVTRREMRLHNLCHRAVYIFVFNGDGQLYVQRRTLSKDLYPGYLDLAAGGVVGAGESYDEAAYRELEEELGIAGVTLTPRFHFFYQGERNRVWGKVYSCCWDSDLRLQAEEVAAVELMDPQSILTATHPGRYTPDSLVALKRMLHTDADQEVAVR
ncbi:NUDIX hydrolase YfcD [Aestuariirhabdus litorea]|uniref:NUDIX hydrolase YfcD n=1 Tax=Aestuariirhabdus litorea TaxID=2528527 RepID=A0A3P3VRW5_9GAMM|nr:NUDIX hydrolase YfcD [Aestuariirhabdus litorea]RRJ85057.1 NUDIX hydrolase YfcD [Aestuariirhabdus litorea]RWW98282.1 NUDIX hydrolase YfcD [Endozoicomonadaceae bacterium GTF-13]